MRSCDTVNLRIQLQISLLLFDLQAALNKADAALPFAWRAVVLTPSLIDLTEAATPITGAALTQVHLHGMPVSRYMWQMKEADVRKEHKCIAVPPGPLAEVGISEWLETAFVFTCAFLSSAYSSSCE